MSEDQFQNSLLKSCFLNCPCTITIAFFGSSYYLCLEAFLSLNSILITCLFIAFNLFFVLSLVCFFCTMLTNPGEIPNTFSIVDFPEDLKESMTDNYMEIDFSLGRVSFCKKCDKYRPARAHHCSICGKCILRYDHHCPFVANCIGIFNTKQFILFTAYSCLASLLCLAILLKYCIDEGSLLLYISCAISGVLSVYILGFSILQIQMVCDNMTTLEMSWKQNVFNTGSSLTNITQIFGTKSLIWLLPIPSPSLNGTTFPIRIRNKSGGFTYFQDKFLV